MTSRCCVCDRMKFGIVRCGPFRNVESEAALVSFAFAIAMKGGALGSNGGEARRDSTR